MKNIHLLPTDKPSRLSILNSGKLNFGAEAMSSSNSKLQHIYITSEEEIKVGDWFIHPDSSCFDKECKEVSIGGYEILRVIKVDENFIYHSAMMAIHKNKNIKKIILTTDQELIKDGVQAIDDEFLEWFVKNPSCEYVKTDLVPVNEFGSEITVGGYGFDKFNYKIIIPQEEPKQEIKNDISVSSRIEHITDKEQLKIIEFIIDYSFKDKKEIYTNGTILVPLFRVLDAISQKGEPYQSS
jgi:hypothetical protein